MLLLFFLLMSGSCKSFFEHCYWILFAKLPCYTDTHTHVHAHAHTHTHTHTQDFWKMSSNCWIFETMFSVTVDRCCMEQLLLGRIYTGSFISDIFHCVKVKAPWIKTFIYCDSKHPTYFIPQWVLLVCKHVNYCCHFVLLSLPTVRLLYSLKKCNVTADGMNIIIHFIISFLLLSACITINAAQYPKMTVMASFVAAGH